MLNRLPVEEPDCANPDEIPSVYMLTVNELPVTSDQIAEATHKDTARDDELYPFFFRKDELSLEDGCIVWSRRVVFPSTYAEYLLHGLHTIHPGIVRMKSHPPHLSVHGYGPSGHGREYMLTLQKRTERCSWLWQIVTQNS